MFPTCRLHFVIVSVVGGVFCFVFVFAFVAGVCCIRCVFVAGVIFVLAFVVGGGVIVLGLCCWCMSSCFC